MVRTSVRWTLTCTLLSLLAGCLATTTGRPKPPGTKPVFVSAARVPGVNEPVPDHWQRVFVGELQKHPHLEGYMRTRTTEEDDRLLVLHWVYDNEFRLSGVMTDNGKTTRFDRHGRPDYLGVLTTEEGLLAVLGHDKVEPVHLASMPQPAE